MNVISYFINNRDEIKQFIFKYELDEFLGRDRQFNYKKLKKVLNLFSILYLYDLGCL